MLTPSVTKVEHSLWQTIGTISCINNTKQKRTILFLLEKIEDSKLGLFQDAPLAGDVVHVWITNKCSDFGVRKKQTAVSRNCSESDM